ncbi:MAG: GNAT family N-acetyltransferase [Vicinamibacteria bacterium]|nr:GNAT family N-acetyltransferase [Vicinamibacteria bacterium]
MLEALPYPFADLDLSRRLERTEAQSNIEFVDARALAFPQSGASRLEVAGAHAMFDGVESPLTQTFGLGMEQPVTEADLIRIEKFFTDMGAPVFHEVSPLADPSAFELLNRRQYRPFEFTSVMFRPIGPRADGERINGSVVARRVTPDEAEIWAQTSSRGWSETPELSAFMLEFARVAARKASGYSFLAELDGAAIGTGGLTIHQNVALLAGASTVPEGRRQGAQKALLEARLGFAAEQGCDVAMMCALPGSTSQRNAERQGFRIAYTRIKFRL